ncbi:sigma-54 dependent transcriptional regulator [Thermosulfurimonas sp. F29]|uniref:sigma-54 dependent transcriptional regulator n=1 Tax=Thermosulfurimonas sp. F29 TaxID=2867247 RepID=UPI001C8281D1|nr:sigma-54 dependent transcriptional regulator [Thermosulfurimonas sp. F29]MBX6423061.1 sigma-54 dependent transcriptional regulator [Thermosulfurimonas sp. F29]
MSGQILFVSQSHELTTLSEKLRSEGLEILQAPEWFQAVEILDSGNPAVVVIEVSGQGPSPRRILDEFKKRKKKPAIIFLARRVSLEEAVAAVREGAYDFRLLDTDPEILKRLILTAWREHRTSIESEDFLTRDPRLRSLLEKLRPVARSRAPILIMGESGTGKEVLARWIHRISDRTRGPFLAINCAALPEALLESELFGYEKGAFSGALTRKKGKFELADGGTILLDEITEMPLTLQAKLLRVLQEGEVDRLGGAYPVKVDVRVIATTNRNIEAEVSAGRFREDLYFRLNVIPVRLPPLRERPSDIPFLAEYFFREFTRLYRKNIRGFAPGVLDTLKGYEFPGNVRELKNLIERAVLLCEGPWITLEDLLWSSRTPFDHSTMGNSSASGKFKPLRELEREAILEALRACGGNRTRAAELLGISVRTLRNKLRLYRAQGLL